MAVSQLNWWFMKVVRSERSVIDIAG